MILSQEKVIVFTRNVSFFTIDRFKTARRVFYHLLISTEPYEKTESDLLSFSSLQVLISLIFAWNPWKFPSFVCYLHYLYRKSFGKCSRSFNLSGPTFGQEVLYLWGAGAKRKDSKSLAVFSYGSVDVRRCQKTQRTVLIRILGKTCTFRAKKLLFSWVRVFLYTASSHVLEHAGWGKRAQKDDRWR